MRKSWVVLVVTLMSAGSPAWAQTGSHFGKQGSVSLGAERLFGLSHASDGGASITTISLIGSSGNELSVAPYGVPRIGFDYFVLDGLSLGLGAEFANISPENASSVTILGLNPRVGYAVRASDVLSLWPRAGISYVHLSTGDPAPADSRYLLAATIELQVVVTPVRHFGFLIGPTVDIGVAATGSKLTQYGLQAGLIGWF